MPPKHVTRRSVLQVGHWVLKNAARCTHASQAHSKAHSLRLHLAVVFFCRSTALPCSETKCCAPTKWCSTVPGGPKRGDTVHQKFNYKIIRSATFQCTKMSFTHYSLVVTPKTLPPTSRSTRRGTHHSNYHIKCTLSISPQKPHCTFPQ